jgi:Ca2+/Na+ antiporter|tara:strand:+ start:508 stop:1656 length:1149 start_codon:yes stop_codon:yes gene_type:complete
MEILLALGLILISCLIIWKASDGFEAASEYLGRNMSEGVRGATINAIGSSMPELFTTIFFLLYMSDTDGFSGGIGTTAGSAIFNGMIIPAVVIFVVLISGIAKSINVSKKVILRDGLFLIGAEIILIFLISGTTLNWWHGLVLMLTYAVYMTYMLTSMKKMDNNDDGEDDGDDDDNSEVGVMKGLLTLNLEAVFIRNNKIATNNSWTLLLVSMAVIGSACLLLVFSCEMIGDSLGIHIMFISVVLASAATSVPDTIISMRDAKKGNYNDAIANALGSNIFDICFALGFPLFLYCIIYGPINMDPETLEFTSQLRILLLFFTIIAFFIYYIGSKMGKAKAFLLIGIYLLFTLYIIGASIESEWAMQITNYLSQAYTFIKGGGN